MKKNVIEELGSTDIYLIDQLMKRRIDPSFRILDAGYGKGRNLEYFIRNHYDIEGIDLNDTYRPIVLEKILEWNADFDASKIRTGKVEEMPYEDESFDFVFSVAVLHFAHSHDHFNRMLEEMLRVTKKGGYLLFRMTSWHTFDLFPKNDSGLVELIDGPRYMLDILELKARVENEGMRFADPIKTTNVDGHRTMTTIVIQK